MIITNIEQQKNNAERYNIYINNKYSVSVDVDLLYELKLEEGMEIDEAWLVSIIYKSAAKKAFNTCINLLARSNKTEWEIKRKLNEKGYEAAVIDQVVEKLKSLDYINDEKYVEAWIRSKISNSAYSKKVIFAKLLQKGINRSLIQEKIEENIIDEFSSAQRLANKKEKALKGSVMEKKSKLFNFLYGKGFSSDVCYRVIDYMFKAEIE